MTTSFCRMSLNTENLKNNYARLQAMGTSIMPVVKANAYGHGLLEVARPLWEEGADHMAVGTVAEGVQLRLGGFNGVIIALLGAISDSEVEAVRGYQIVPVVHDWAGLTHINAVLGEMEPFSPSSIALKCNTGMARLGFDPEDMPAVADFLDATPHLHPDYLLSHFAVADEPEEDGFTQEQTRKFENALQALRFKFPGITTSLGNSACLLGLPQWAGDLARPGLALYGVNPFLGRSRESMGAGLLPVMEICAPVLEVHSLMPGECLGYGRSYVASEKRAVAVVGIGYADGYRRGSGQVMTVCGQRAPVIGRISMQMTCLDVTALPDVKPGELVYILGGPGDAVTVDELASWWGTIPYEALCMLGRR